MLISHATRWFRGGSLRSFALRGSLALLALGAATPSARADLFVGSYWSEVRRYDGVSGASKGVFASGGGLVHPYGVAFGTAGDLFVVSYNSDQVLRYDGVSGAFEGVFASGGGLDGPFGVTFGTGGDLFVSSSSVFTNNVLRYDGATGAFEGVFASGGGLSQPVGLVFGPDGDLFVAGFNNNQVRRYDGVSGAFESVFASSGLIGPVFLTFDAVPEPGGFALLGVSGLALLRRRAAPKPR